MQCERCGLEIPYETNLRKHSNPEECVEALRARVAKSEKWATELADTLHKETELAERQGALIAAVVPNCKCGKIATYRVTHRYAEPHDDCDDCRVAYVKKADADHHHQHSTDLDADSIDSADSWGKKLPHADAVRKLNALFLPQRAHQ
jgi:hypothetical protein